MSDEENKSMIDEDMDAKITDNERPRTAEQKQMDDLLTQLNTAQAKIDELTDAVLRAKADAQNAIHRATKDAENTRRYSNEKFAKELLPVIDSLERCLDTRLDENNELTKAVHDGIALTHQMFLQALEKSHIEQVNPLYESFDPHLHEAIKREKAAGTVKSGSVIQVLQRGYTLSGRLIRAALVVVAE